MQEQSSDQGFSMLPLGTLMALLAMICFLFQSAPQNYLLVFVSEKTGLPSEQLAGVREVLEEFK